METITLTANDLKIKLLVVMQNQKASADFLGTEFGIPTQKLYLTVEKEIIEELRKEEFFDCEVKFYDFQDLDGSTALKIKHEHGEILLFSK